MLRTRIVGAWLVLGLVASCAGRTPWPIYQPQWLTTSAPSEAFEAMLSFLRMSGYEVDEFDEQRMFIRVRARLDQDVVLRPTGGGVERSAVGRTSYFNIQLFDDGRVMIGASGYHLRAGTVDPRLDAEMHRLVTDLYGCFPSEPNVPIGP